MIVVGILGGGQLGRMLALAGYPLGLRFVVLDPSSDAPAGRVADHIQAAYDDDAALEELARRAHVVTYEFENVPVASARRVETICPVFPSSGVLETAQDRLLEKSLFRDLGIPTAPFETVANLADLESAARKLGLPAVLKTRREGYDGKGQRTIRRAEELSAAFEELGGRPLILEGFVPFERELSILAVRDKKGDTAFWPLVQNKHDQGILRSSLAPAPDVNEDLQAMAEREATRVLDALGYVGVLAIELFQKEGTLYANEMAPRVHNSGHWTIEGAETSQFENHLRAGIGYPLGSTRPVGYTAMVNLIGACPPPERMAAMDGLHMHLYDKEPRPGRKVGHVTFRGADPSSRDRAVSTLAAWTDEPGAGS